MINILIFYPYWCCELAVDEYEMFWFLYKISKNGISVNRETYVVLMVVLKKLIRIFRYLNIFPNSFVFFFFNFSDVILLYSWRFDCTRIWNADLRILNKKFMVFSYCCPYCLPDGCFVAFRYSSWNWTWEDSSKAEL